MAIIRVRNDDGVIIDIPAIVGPPGADYVLTEEDKAEIAERAAELVDVPEGGGADLTGYATEQYVKDYAQPAGDYALKTEIPNVPVQSVNGKTGAVNLSASDVSALPSTTKIPAKTSELTNDSGFITGYTETDPTVPAWAKNSSKPSYSKSEVGLSNVDNVKQYSASNPPPYPVTSVNGKTGAVTVDVPTVPTKVSAFTNDAGYLTKHQDISGLAKKFDPSGYDIPVLYLTGDISPIKESKDNEVTGIGCVYGEWSGTCSLKGQGSSSYIKAKELGDRGKFNYTIKLSEKISIENKWEKDEEKKNEPGKSWGAQKKYCLKANFIDHTHARNIVSARLWSQMVDSRSTKNANLASCPNNGAVDGFPVAIVLNGEFHGLYTWNIPKDKWMFGMGSGTQEAVICADDATYPAVDLRVHSKVDGSDHELEEVTDENNAGWVATSLNNVIDLCVNSYGADLDTTIAQYLDWESAIDYYIFTVIMDGRDMTGKNYIMATWNGTKWVFSAYDMDSTYGLQWNGYALLPPHEGVTFELFRKNRVMELIYRFKTNALKARYKKLRETVLSEYAMAYMFENFTCSIPSSLLNEDAKRWTALPSTASNTVDHILRWLHHRLAIVDKWVDALPAQETPIAPENRTGDVVSISTDASGSIYNGVGYKNGYIVSVASGGTASEVAYEGMSVSGFIPITKDNVIKVTTDAWNISPNPSKIIFYDGDLKPMAYYTQHGYVSLFNGYKNATSILAKDKQSVTYNADGTTTLNIAFGANCTTVKYCRINATCPGKNLIVIREGEVPEHAPDFEPEVVIDNYIPVSIDASGAVYNGTGYKNGYRVSTSDGETDQEKSGMFTTGFIPVKMTDVIRVTSSTWGTSPSNAKITFYDVNFKAIGFYTANGFVTTFNGHATGSSSTDSGLQAKENQSVTVGTDGMTTLNIKYSPACNPAYFRYDGCGSGANAVVKLN